MNPKVDVFLEKAKKWPKELKQLRSIILECGLTEELKWGQPCYTYQDKNILILGEFKEHCILSFLKGVLLHDQHQLLSKPGENSQSARIIRFKSVQEIVAIKAILKAYIYDALEIEKMGLKLDVLDTSELKFVQELQKKLAKDLAFKTAFENLTPGRQRAYNIYFSAPKQSKTRDSRIDAYTQRILNGKGFNDCVCGLSKKMPSCDGSHKNIR